MRLARIQYYRDILECLAVVKGWERNVYCKNMQFPCYTCNMNVWAAASAARDGAGRLWGLDECAFVTSSRTRNIIRSVDSGGFPVF